MRFVSWNVNGLRAVMKRAFLRSFDELNADVFALQETKLQEGQIDLDLPGYTQSWSYAERKGYSGTAVFSKEVPLQVIHEVGVPELDTEGRVVICEFEHPVVRECLYPELSKRTSAYRSSHALGRCLSRGMPRS